MPPRASKRSPRPPSGFAALPLLLLVVLGTACANLTAIREFGTTSANSAAYSQLITDYVAAPTRRKRYEPEYKAQLERDSKLRAAQKPLLLLRQTALVEYMDALGKLAADDVVDYDPQIDALAKAVKEDKFAGEKDADAFGAVAKVLTRAATDGWRQRKLRIMISEENENVQSLIASLHTVVEKAILGNDIANDRVAVRSYYGTLLRQSSDPAGKAALTEWEETRDKEIAAHEKAAKAYLHILDSISRGHQALFDHVGDLKSKEVLQQAQTYADDLQKLYATLH